MIEPGGKAPDFSLPDQVVLDFYPKAEGWGTK
jgi:hypothetical protein